MSTTDKMVRYRLPGDKLIRTCPERLTRTNGFRIQGGVVLQEMQPVSLPKIMDTFVEEIDEDISKVAEVKRRGRKPKQ